MAIEENVSAEDMMAIEPTPKGDLEKDTGPLSFQQQRKRAAQTALMMKGVPKKWRGGGDYFFEVVAPGKLKITGGDKAKSLTGGKSVVITDREKISEIIEKARGGDILERDVGYEAEEQVDPQQMLQADAQRRANIAGPEAMEQMEEYQKQVSLGETDLTPDVGESPIEEPLNLGESEADEVVLTLREMGYSDEMIEGIPERLRDQFLSVAKKWKSRK